MLIPRYITLLLVLVLTMFSWSARSLSDAAEPDEIIRIAIVKSVPEVTISGEGILATGENGEPLSLTFPVTVKSVRDELAINGRSFRRLVFAGSSAVYVNNKPYRGLAEITPAGKGLTVINQLPLEEYLVGLINCEISSAWPIEAVKAQAIIARTYAINRKAARATAPYHLESSVIDQVYDGCLIEDSRAHRAVMDTRGMVLTYGGGVIQAFYHSSCGGRTEAAENVWGSALPYLKGVECQYCLTSAAATLWEQKLPLGEIEDRLKSAGYKLSGLTDIRPGGMNSRGRRKNVTFVALQGGATLSGDQFRKAIGYGVIKSTRFSVKVAQGEASFTGSGNGHGVGLCQWGAKQRALDGFGCSEILSYYYPGTELKKLSEINR